MADATTAFIDVLNERLEQAISTLRPQGDGGRTRADILKYHALILSATQTWNFQTSAQSTSLWHVS